VPEDGDPLYRPGPGRDKFPGKWLFRTFGDLGPPASASPWFFRPFVGGASLNRPRFTKSDTAGEFARSVGPCGLPPPGELILPSPRLIGDGREFASSIKSAGEPIYRGT